MKLTKQFNVNTYESEFFREDGSLATNEEIEAFLLEDILHPAELFYADHWSNRKFLDEDREAIKEAKYWDEMGKNYNKPVE